MVTCVVPPGFSGAYDVTVPVGENKTSLVGSFTRDDASSVWGQVLSAGYYPDWAYSRLSVPVHTYGLSTETNLRIKVGDNLCRNVDTTILSNNAEETLHVFRTLEGVWPSMSDQSFAMQTPDNSSSDEPLAVFLSDDLGDDVNMNGTNVIVGRPRFAISPTYIIPSSERYDSTTTFLVLCLNSFSIFWFNLV